MFHTPSEPVTAAAWVGIWLIKRRALLIQQFDIKLEEDLKVEGKGAGREGHERKYRFRKYDRFAGEQDCLLTQLRRWQSLSNC
jgi:hypothetical protein